MLIRSLARLVAIHLTMACFLWGLPNTQGFSASPFYTTMKTSQQLSCSIDTSLPCYVNRNSEDQTVGGVVTRLSDETPSMDPEVDIRLEKPSCNIVVCGVGGGGGNAVNHMIESNTIDGVCFWAINTDVQALSRNIAENKLNIGRELTRGLGAGGDPKQGAKAAMENTHDLKQIFQGADMVFITAGMGGGTGSGAAPVLAEIAKNDCKCLTVAVVTKPFAFEGRRRMRQAEEAILELQKHVDTFIVVSNDKLLELVPDETPVSDAFLMADDVLRQGVVGITEIITRPGVVNVDFADLQAVMKDAGVALMGVGSGVGKHRASDAAYAAISSPLLDHPIRNAKRVVFNIMGGEDMGLAEINEASEVIYENCDADANIIFGALVDPEMGDEIRITVVACDSDTSEVFPSRRQTATMSAVTELEPRLDSALSTGRVAHAPQKNLENDDPPAVPVNSETVPVSLLLKKRGFRKPELTKKKSIFRRLFGRLFGN